MRSSQDDPRKPSSARSGSGLARDTGRNSPDALEWMQKKRMTANAEVGTARRKRQFEQQFATGKDEEIASRSGISARVDGVRIGPGRWCAMMLTVMMMWMMMMLLAAAAAAADDDDNDVGPALGATSDSYVPDAFPQNYARYLFKRRETLSSVDFAKLPSLTSA